MSAIQAEASQSLRVYLCGAIKPRKSDNFFMNGTVRHFVASGVVAFEGRLAHLPVRENQVLAAILSDGTYTQPESIRDSIVWADEDGGPLWLNGLIRTTIKRLRERLIIIGLDLVRLGHARAPYRIRRAS